MQNKQKQKLAKPYLHHHHHPHYHVSLIVIKPSSSYLLIREITNQTKSSQSKVTFCERVKAQHPLKTSLVHSRVLNLHLAASPKLNVGHISGTQVFSPLHQPGLPCHVIKNRFSQHTSVHLFSLSF